MNEELGSEIPTFKSYAPGPGFASFLSCWNLGRDGKLNVGALELDRPAIKYFPCGSNYVFGWYAPGPGLCLVVVNITKIVRGNMSTVINSPSLH
jgi:hypothetical protein